MLPHFCCAFGHAYFSWLQFLIHSTKELDNFIPKAPSNTKDTLISRDRELAVL